MSRIRMRRLRVSLIVALSVIPAVIPFACGQSILRGVTPFLLDGGNTFMTSLIKLVAPLVLP